MNKQLLRLKQRSNSDVLQVAESDDSNNLYVNVADGKVDVGTVDSITITNIDNVTSLDTVDKVTEVNNVSDVDSVNLVDTVTSITDTVKVINYDRFPTNIYTSGYLTIESGTSELEFDELTLAYDAAYLNKPGKIQIGNLSAFYDISVHVRQVLTTTGGTLRVATHQYVVPPVQKMRPTEDAYSSCVTYNATGPTWTDQSVNFSQENGYDAPFPISEVDDAIYFGCKSKFNSLSIFVETAGVYDATFVWEFWNGSAWVSPTILVDNTNELQSTAGQYYILLFEGLTNWTANQPDATSMVNQYWLRLRCSVFNSVTTSPILRTVLIKPVQYNSITTFNLIEIFGNANTSTQFLVGTTAPVDSTHELLYNIGVGVSE